MPNLFNNFNECFGFSHIMKSTDFKMFIALKVISSKFPIGVDIIYRPFFKSLIFILFTFIISCAPQNYINNNKEIENPDFNSEVIFENNTNTPDEIIDSINFRALNLCEWNKQAIQKKPYFFQIGFLVEYFLALLL